MFKSTIDPPNTAALMTGERTAVLKNGYLKGEIYITKKKHIWDLKITGGIGGEAINGGAVLGGGGRYWGGGGLYFFRCKGAG